MAGRQGTYSLWKNPIITERQHKALFMMLQGAAIGIMLGIITRAAWDFGIVASMALALRDIGVATWSMLQDIGAACRDFLQFISHQRGS